MKTGSSMYSKSAVFPISVIVRMRADVDGVFSYSQSNVVPIYSATLSVRSRNVLYKYCDNDHFVCAAKSQSDVGLWRNCGRATLVELHEWLVSQGIEPAWKPIGKAVKGKYATN